MSTQVILIGQTRFEVESTFGVFTLSVGEFGRPAQRVAPFDSGVSASQFVAALTKALEGQEVDWEAGRSWEARQAAKQAELEEMIRERDQAGG